MIDAQTASSSEPVAAPEPRPRPAPPRRRARWLRAVYWLAVVATLGFNAWWYWRDTRPVPTLATVSGWLSSGRFAEAESALREHLRRSPCDGDARTMLARALAARHDSLGCARQLSKVPDWWPTKAEATYREGQTYLLVDRARDAERAWQAILKEDAVHPAPLAILLDATVELLKLYAVEDRWEDAPPVIWGAYDRARPEDRALLLVMRMRSELERVAPAESIGRLERFVAADPDDVEARRSLALAELALGRADAAQRHFLECLKLRPNDPRVWRDYLGMLLERGDLDALRATLPRVPATADTEPRIWLFRAIDREKQGDLEGAERMYREALARNPNVTEYHYRFASVENRLGRRDEAARERKRAQELRAARSELLPQFSDYLDLKNHRPTTTKQDLPTCVRRLATVCETLGWVRAADAWIEELSRVEADGGG